MSLLSVERGSRVNCSCLGVIRILILVALGINQFILFVSGAWGVPVGQDLKFVCRSLFWVVSGGFA